jgi:hypothetical protein
LFVLLNLPGAAADVVWGHSDIAATVTARFAEARNSWAEQIDRGGLRYWSDDPGLNARVSNPPVLYPLLQALMVKRGVLGLDSFTTPLEHQEYDVILLTGVVWSFQGVRTVPEEWEATLHRHYELVSPNDSYQVWIPRIVPW